MVSFYYRRYCRKIIKRNTFEFFILVGAVLENS